MKTSIFDGGSFLVEGVSAGGVGTSLSLPQYKVLVDTAQGLPFGYPMNHIFITHGHMDHAGGIAYICSQRGLMGLSDLHIYCPEPLQEPLKNILEQWQKIEGFEYSYKIQGLVAGQQVQISPKNFVCAFETTHRVPSLGYCLFETTHKLKPEFQGLAGRDIAEARRSGRSVEEPESTPLFAYTGDTTLDFLKSCPESVLSARAFFIDCTYYGDRKTIADARLWGHNHLDEILQHFHRFRGNKLVLTHPSRRYKKSELERILKGKVPAESQHRVALFP